MPLRNRAQGTAVGTLVNWITNAIIGKVTPLILSGIGPYTYLVYGGFCFIMCLYVAKWVPETAHVSLEQMGALFRTQKTRKRAHSHVDPHRTQGARSSEFLSLKEVEVEPVHVSSSSEAKFGPSPLTTDSNAQLSPRDSVGVMITSDNQKAWLHFARVSPVMNRGGLGKGGPGSTALTSSSSSRSPKAPLLFTADSSSSESDPSSLIGECS